MRRRALWALTLATLSVTVGSATVVEPATLQELTREFGSPLYVFDEHELRSQCREYVQAFTSRHEDTDVTYASKAYLSRWMARIARCGTRPSPPT